VAISKPGEIRKQKAQATRKRMLQAAYRLFCQGGYVSTTMESIAREAGVAVQTVYFTFHNKTAILKEVFDTAVLGDEAPVPPQARPWFAEMEREPDALRALRILVDNASEILRRVAPLQAVMVAASGDPVAVEVYQRGERLRREGYGRIIRILGQKHGLRARLSPGRAVDVLFVMLSPELFHAMAGCGWSFAEWKNWITDLLGRELLSKRALGSRPR